MCILLLEVIALHTVSLYFTSKRRLATSIVTLGTCTSQVLFTPLITWLQEELSQSGATLVMAALTLNCCVAAMFLHPVHWHKRERKMGYPEDYVGKSILSYSSSPSLVLHNPSVSSNGDLLRQPEEIIRNQANERVDQIDCSEDKEKGTLSPFLSPGSPKSAVPGFAHPVKEHQRECQKNSTENYIEKETLSPFSSSAPHKPVYISGKFLKLAQESLRNLRYFKSPRVALVSTILACNLSSLVNIWAIVPFALKTDGYSSQDVALCLSVAGLCNMASRLLNGVLSCWQTFTVTKLYIIGSAMSAFGIIGE